ncbi:MAG TPA: hypothetical protein VHQ22_18715 [Terriglobales bacterium]|jgi:hypothetical protein|nr:hypothetical protein [Terriglobales bacterium]
MSEAWNTYRTRFLVKARQLTEPMTFTDVLGREHHGNPGDYVVQSAHGLRIAPRDVFEDVYVLFTGEESVLPSDSSTVSNPESLAV